MPSERGLRKPPPTQVKLHHLMDGLIYPAVIGAGLVVLGLRVADSLRHVPDKPPDEAILGRVALGMMLLYLYGISYVAFKDVEENGYGWRPFLADIGEALIMFVCFLMLSLLENGKPEEVLYPVIAGLLAIDILVLQPIWLTTAFGEGERPLECFKKHGYRNGALRIGAAGTLIAAIFVQAAIGWIPGPSVSAKISIVQIAVAIIVSALIARWDYLAPAAESYESLSTKVGKLEDRVTALEPPKPVTEISDAALRS
jgi:hypothetical protein